MIYCKKLILHFVIGKSEDIEDNPLKGVRFSDFYLILRSKDHVYG